MDDQVHCSGLTVIELIGAFFLCFTFIPKFGWAKGLFVRFSILSWFSVIRDLIWWEEPQGSFPRSQAWRDVSALATKKQNQIFPLPHLSHVFEEDKSIMIMGSAEYIRTIT